MKQGTKLILTFVGAGVATGVLLSGTVAEATSSHPNVAMGGEGLAALGGAFWAWKKNSMLGAAIGGAAAGLLAGSVRSSLSAPATSPPSGVPQIVEAPPQPAPSIAVGEPAPNSGPTLIPRVPLQSLPSIGSPTVLYVGAPPVAPKAEVLR